jgi:hypothetical protein
MCRYQPERMPAIDDIIMQILGMSEAQYESAWIIGNAQYDARRPAGWPMAKTILSFYGLDNWRTLVSLHIETSVITSIAHRQQQARQRVERNTLRDEDRQARNLHRKLSNQQRIVYNVLRRGASTVPKIALAVFGADDKYAKSSIHYALMSMRKRGVKMSVEHRFTVGLGRQPSIFRLA